ADHLRGFLFVATRNRLIDRIRQHRDALEREEPLDDGDHQHTVPCPQPRPSEVAQAGDLWERILAHCPPEHRTLVVLRRPGAPHRDRLPPAHLPPPPPPPAPATALRAPGAGRKGPAPGPPTCPPGPMTDTPSHRAPPAPLTREAAAALAAQLVEEMIQRWRR